MSNHLKNLDKEKNVIKFISDWNKKNKLIASTCHGAQLLISAKATKGKKVSAYYSIEDDITNSGAIYVNAPVVIDKNIISSPHYNWMGEWMKAAIKEVKKIKVNLEKDIDLKIFKKAALIRAFEEEAFRQVEKKYKNSCISFCWAGVYCFYFCYLF